MSHPVLYDDDVLLWSEQQAEIIRRLGRTRGDLPDDFALENVAEEIESVGRSELAAVESQIQNILTDLIKLGVEPHSDAARHRRAEILAFHAEMRRRYAPSMRQRIDMHELWRVTRMLPSLSFSDEAELVACLPQAPPFELDDILGETLDAPSLAARLRATGDEPVLTPPSPR